MTYDSDMITWRPSYHIYLPYSLCSRSGEVKVKNCFCFYVTKTLRYFFVLCRFSTSPVCVHGCEGKTLSRRAYCCVLSRSRKRQFIQVHKERLWLITNFVCAQISRKSLSLVALACGEMVLIVSKLTFSHRSVDGGIANLLMNNN